MITIVVEGPEKSGKGHAIALIGNHLKSLGIDVKIQSENTHNARKLAQDDDEHVKRLLSSKIVIKEMRTFDREGHALETEDPIFLADPIL